jgi:L-fucose mutarotase
MLKHIPGILNPDLLKILAEMGHGDEIVIADGNFPAAFVAKKLIRMDGHGVPDILAAILKFFPLDTYTELPVALMAVNSHENVKPAIWNEYKTIIKTSEEPFKEFEFVERFTFYERAKAAFAVIATSESALYANIILRKGVVV